MLRKHRLDCPSPGMQAQTVEAALELLKSFDHQGRQRQRAGPKFGDQGAFVGVGIGNSMVAMLRFENVTSGYDGIPINRNISLEVAEGQVVPLSAATVSASRRWRAPLSACFVLPMVGLFSTERTSHSQMPEGGR